MNTKMSTYKRIMSSRTPVPPDDFMFGADSKPKFEERDPNPPEEFLLEGDESKSKVEEKVPFGPGFFLGEGSSVDNEGVRIIDFNEEANSWIEEDLSKGTYLVPFDLSLLHKVCNSKPNYH